MKKVLILLVLLATLVPMANAQLMGGRVSQLLTPSQGYDAVIDTVMANVNSTTYFALSAPTGYRFQLVELQLKTPSEDSEACSIRFWASATDSTSINLESDGDAGAALTITGGLMEAGNNDGGPNVWQFPINCAKVSITDHADTDDFILIGYLRKY